MAELFLTPEEEAILKQVLRRCLSDLELEILHTDHAEFRQLLRSRRQLLERIHEGLSVPDSTKTPA